MPSAWDEAVEAGGIGVGLEGTEIKGQWDSANPSHWPTGKRATANTRKMFVLT